MEIVGFYVLFSLVTAVHGLMELMFPIFNSRETRGLETQRKYIIYVTFFFTSIMIAPIIFLACIVPSVGETFREHLEKGIFE